MPFAALLVALLGQIAAKEPNRLLPDRLRGLPVGILALHHPNPVFAVREEGMYVWKHDTTVKSLVGDLQIVEFGAFLYSDKGWTLRVTMDAAEFSKLYRCKGGLLRKGATYTDPKSWRRGESLFAGDALWFYIGKDKSGKRYKGTALVETEGKAPAPKG